MKMRSSELEVISIRTMAQETLGDRGVEPWLPLPMSSWATLP